MIPDTVPEAGGYVQGGAGQIDSHDPVERAARRIPPWVRRAEHCHDRGSDGMCEVHRPGIPGDEQVRLREKRGEGEEVDAIRHVNHAGRRKQ